MLLKNQSQAAPFRGLPVEEKMDSGSVTTVSAETVQLYYSNAGVRTTDAGQLAGVAVEGVLARNNIKNSTGKCQATAVDTSLSFTAGALTTEVPINLEIMESVDEASFANRLSALTASLANGEYCVDYGKGIIYGKKTTNATTLAATTYKVLYGDVSSVGSVDVTSIIPGTGATNLGKAEDAQHTSGDVGVLILGVRKDTAGTLAADNNDYTVLQTDANGALRVSNISSAVFSERNSAALEAGGVIKAAAGTFYKLSGRIDSTQASATYYIQVHNAASAPAEGTSGFLIAPIKVAHITGTDSIFDIDLTPGGCAASTGIYYCLSSTEFTKTIGGNYLSSSALYL